MIKLLNFKKRKDATEPNLDDVVRSEPKEVEKPMTMKEAFENGNRATRRRIMAHVKRQLKKQGHRIAK